MHTCKNPKCGKALNTIDPRKRYCDKKCRQAAWRFKRHVGRARDAATKKRLGVADPPYPGKAFYYRDHPDYGGEVDHTELVLRLDRDYDGWALCTSAEGRILVDEILLDHGIEGVRMGIWARGSRPQADPKGPLRAYELVFYRPVREGVSGPWPDDVLVGEVSIYRSDPDRVVGAKPPQFATWVFDLLGARRNDSLDDLFPGSRNITQAWDIYTGRDDQDAGQQALLLG